RPRSVLKLSLNIDISLRSQHFQGRAVSVPANDGVNAAIACRESFQHHLIQEIRQPRVLESDLPVPRALLKAEAGLKRGEERPGRPGLRRAGDRIERRSSSRIAR